MSWKKILETKSVEQALSVVTNFSDYILGPAVKYPKHWDMKNIVLLPTISLVILVLYIPVGLFTMFVFSLQKRPNCPANGPDYDTRNLNFSIINRE